MSRLRAVAYFLLDRIYAVAITLGWQPREEREKQARRAHP